MPDTTTMLPFNLATTAAGTAPAGLGGRLIRALDAMLQAVRGRRELAGLDDCTLADMGMSRADALREAGRAPWDTAPAAWHPHRQAPGRTTD